MFYPSYHLQTVSVRYQSLTINRDPLILFEHQPEVFLAPRVVFILSRIPFIPGMYFIIILRKPREVGDFWHRDSHSPSAPGFHVWNGHLMLPTWGHCISIRTRGSLGRDVFWQHRCRRFKVNLSPRDYFITGLVWVLIKNFCWHFCLKCLSSYHILLMLSGHYCELGHARFIFPASGNFKL